jgi:hypothetical protein
MAHAPCGKGGVGGGHLQGADPEGAQGHGIDRSQRAGDSATPGRVDHRVGPEGLHQLGGNRVHRLREGLFDTMGPL